jgi:putative membrane protein
MKTLTHVLVLAMLSAPFVVSADDTGAKTKTSDTSKADTSKTDASKAKPAKLKEAELQVMAHYHAVNLMEIDLGHAAAKKGTSDGVKAYGKMLVKDHGDADKQLFALAKKTAQKIPAEKPANDVEKQEKAEDKAAAAKIMTMKGADFDREYLRMMVQGHDKELAKIDSKVAEVENGELADSLKALKPVLQHHADEARDLQKNLNTPSASNLNTNMPGSTTPPAKR